jgi:hypothetical protein
MVKLYLSIAASRHPKDRNTKPTKNIKLKNIFNKSLTTGHGSYAKGRTSTGGIGKGKETQNLKVFDVPTAEEIK